MLATFRKQISIRWHEPRPDVTAATPMPTYVYEIIEPDGTGGERFEVIQPMTADPLEKHPLTGVPVRRVITGFNVAGKWSDMGMNNKLSDKHLDQIGFTKYVRGGDGYYEKTAGSGPDLISGKGGD
jgi:predicted nucleic acid-binding Zn ribbon protein